MGLLISGAVVLTEKELKEACVLVQLLEKAKDEKNYEDGNYSGGVYGDFSEIAIMLDSEEPENEEDRVVMDQRGWYFDLLDIATIGYPVIVMFWDGQKRYYLCENPSGSDYVLSDRLANKYMAMSHGYGSDGWMENILCGGY